MELRSWLLVAVIPIAASLLPYAAGYLSQGEDEIFMGFLRSDNAFYAALMSFQAVGDFSNPFDAHDRSPFFFNPPLFLAGHLLKLGLSVPAVYVLFQVAVAVGYFVALFYLAQAYLERWLKPKVFLAMVCVGGGFGWLVFMLYYLRHPAAGLAVNTLGWEKSYWAPDLSFMRLTPFSTLGAGLEVVDQALLVTTLLLFHRALKSGRLADYALSVAATWVLTWTHFYGAIIASLTVVFYPLCYLVVNKSLPPRFYKLLACILFFGAPLAAYAAAVLRPYEAQARWFPEIMPVHQYIIGYGFVLLLALFGLEPLFRRRRPIDLLVLAWIAATVFMMQNIVRPHHFVSYLYIPLALLAAEGFTEAVVPLLWRLAPAIGSMRIKGSAVLLGALVFAVVPSNIVYSRIMWEWVTDDGRPQLYLRQDEYAALQWLRANSTHRDVVLTTPWGSPYANWAARYMPALAGVTTLSSYLNLSPELARKKNQPVEAILVGHSNEDERYQLLVENAVRYLYYGPQERKVMMWDPESAPYLSKRYDSATVKIYAVDGMVDKAPR